MTSKERVKAIGEQFTAEREVFAGFVTAIRKRGDVPSLAVSPEVPAEPDCGKRPTVVQPGEYWFWFAGHYYRARHLFESIGYGRYVSAILIDTPLATEAEYLYGGCARVRFDRHGTVEWASGYSGGPLLETDPVVCFYHMLAGAMPPDPNGAVLEPLREYRAETAALERKPAA